MKKHEMLTNTEQSLDAHVDAKLLGCHGVESAFHAFPWHLYAQHANVALGTSEDPRGILLRMQLQWQPNHNLHLSTQKARSTTRLS